MDNNICYGLLSVDTFVLFIGLQPVNRKAFAPAKTFRRKLFTKIF